MERHTNNVADPVPVDEGHRRNRPVFRVPLLPAVAGVAVVGVVVSAISTQQIALNFAGGPPSSPGSSASPQVTDFAPSHRAGDRHAAADGDSTGRRASRAPGRSAVAVAFHTVSSWTTGFQAEATITNRSHKPVDGWTLTFRYPGTRILSVWHVRVIRRGAVLIARNPADHPVIPPGRTVRVSFTARGAGVLPAACTFNGRACGS